ncbi:MAG: replicative DNA helicase [Flavobacteriales bacterium]
MAEGNPAYSQNQKTSTIIGLERGKIPPQATDLEEAVLGALMIDKKGLDEAIDILEPDFFYRIEHQEIYKIIKKLFNDSQPIDILTVSHALKQNGKLDQIGGDYYLVQLTQKVSSAAHIEYHSRIIQQKYIQRRLIQISSQIIDKSYDETTDVFDLLDEAENKLFEITNGNLKKVSERAGRLVAQAINKIKQVSEQEGLSGVPSGFTKIDQLTAGWQRSDLIILAARPGMGKTAFVLSMAKNMAIQHKKGVAVFSLEMSSVQLVTRLISGETGIDSKKLRKANLAEHEWEQLYSKVKKLEDAPIYIDDTPALSIFDLRAKCRRLVSQHNVECIIIDYLQLMTAGSTHTGNREQEISTISRSLKSIAKELDVPVIALSQLSRAVETRGGSKRPLLSDLRESGAIEQDADIVCFIYRPEYYGLTEWDDEELSSCIGQGEFIIAKHRNGGLDNIRLRFISAQVKFDNLDENPFVTSGIQSFESIMNTEKLPNPSPTDAFEDHNGINFPNENAEEGDFPF